MATTPELAIFIFCLIGCGVSSFFIGRQDGIQGTVEYLVDAGLLEVSDDE